MSIDIFKFITAAVTLIHFASAALRKLKIYLRKDFRLKISLISSSDQNLPEKFSGSAGMHEEHA